MKYFALVVSIFIMISGIAAIVVGTVRLFQGIIALIGFHGHEDERPGLQIVEAVDTYLFSIVVLILAGGIFKLFVGKEETFKDNIVFSKIKSFMDLKVLLWETLLLTLTVWCSLDFFTQVGDSTYQQLILPVSIVLLAFALKLIKGNKE